MSADYIAKKYATTSSQILKWYYAARLPSEKHMNSTLSHEQEEQLVISATAMSLTNHDWSALDVKGAVEKMFGIQTSLGWAYDILKWHKSVLLFQTPTSLGQKHTKEDLYDVSCSFIE